MTNGVLQQGRRREKSLLHWQRSTTIPIWKRKGNPANSANYCPIRLLSHSMKIFERIIDSRVRDIIRVSMNLCGFVANCGTTDAIHAAHMSIKKHREKQEPLHPALLDLEKAFNCVSHEVIWYALRWHGVPEELIECVRILYADQRSRVQADTCTLAEFPISVSLHRGPVLSPLFVVVLVMDAITRDLQRPAPWTLLYADDVMLASEQKEDLESQMQAWSELPAWFGLRLNVKKTEYMTTNLGEPSTIQDDDNDLRKTECFKYLESSLPADGSLAHEDVACIKAVCLKWHLMSGVLCNKNIPHAFKSKRQKCYVGRPVSRVQTASDTRRSESGSASRRLPANFVKLALDGTATFCAPTKTPSAETHVTHVIFDFDGLLVDTESCYAIANQRLLQKFGREFTPEYNAMILGRKEDEAFPMLIKAVGIEDKITPKEYIAQFDAIVEGMLPKCKAMPGAEKLVRHLSKKGVPTAICTGSRGETFERKQKPHEDWLCLITLKVFCPNEPEIKRGKPYPDPYLTTMNRLVNSYESTDSAFTKKMLLLAERYSLDVLKMVASGVLVDQIIAHSNPPGELVNISHELKRMASEINDSLPPDPSTPTEEVLVGSVVEDLQSLTRRVRRVSLSHSPSSTTSSPSSTPPGGATPTDESALSPAPIVPTARPFEPAVTPSRFKRIELV
ncbi:hypothetical protein Y032_0120g884 [Ancylostoma ceylanicum]|uniref:Reverse transcriptase domain-containing protein n=1 Tax=Ancylostoma ceylanicum TaxID=53326 RepID=A0A016TAI2_9BILA|nr:hypothetical protein Y032_0120g884 [Ancylostoma ceylanicum]